MKECGIYLLTHTASNRMYVGQSTDIKTRWYQHRKNSVKSHLSKAVCFYGWGAFTAEILEICHPSMLNVLESQWIAKLKCMSPSGFNLTSGGDRREPSLEARANMSAGQRARIMTEETRIRLSKGIRTGMTHTSESKAKTSSKLMGRTFSDKTKALMTASAKKRATPEYIAKLSYAAAHRHRSDEELKIRSESAKKSGISQETRVKMNASRAKNLAAKKLLRMAINDFLKKEEK